MRKAQLLPVMLLGAFAATVGAQAPHQTLTKTDIERMMAELSNWGRWGKADQLGYRKPDYCRQKKGSRRACKGRLLDLDGA